MSLTPLLGVRVVEVSRGVGASFAGLILSALGAEVRRLVVGDELGPEAAAFYGRGRIELEADELDEAISGARVFVTDLAAEELSELGLPPGESGLNGDQIFCSVTSLGRVGPHSGFVMDDLTEWASGGLAQVTRRPVADDDVEGYVPVLPPGSQAQLLAGLNAATATVAALRIGSGEATLVDVSAQEAVAATLHGIVPTFVFNGVSWGHPDARSAYKGMVLPASDGAIYLRPVEQHQWDALVEWVGRPDWAEALTGEIHVRYAGFGALEALLAEWTSSRTQAELLESAQRLGVPVSKPRTPAQVLEWEQPRSRGALVELGEWTAPALPLIEPADWAGPDAPADGPVGWGTAGRDDAPLAGLRLIDLGWSWAGPFAGMLLSHLGAEVIKVESTKRIDILRFSGAFVDGERGADRGGFFTAANPAKLSCTLDLKDPRGRDLLLELVRSANGVLENFAPRVLGSLGLDFEAMSAVNPAIVLLSMSGYGGTGPESANLAYGDHLLYAGGMAAATGFSEDPATAIGTFYGDPVAGMYGALGLVAGMAEAERTGRGLHLDYAQVEGLMSLMPVELMRASAGLAPLRLGDKSASAAPHGFYRCVGDDAWVALAVHDDRQWRDLAGLVGADAALGVAERLARQDELDDLVSTWTGERSPEQVVRACQGIGVAAYRMMDSPRLLWSTHLRERGFFAYVDHAVMGDGALCGPPFRVGEAGAAVRGPAPLLGEHNRHVFVDLLGLPTSEFEQLVTDGVIADDSVPRE